MEDIYIYMVLYGNLYAYAGVLPYHGLGLFAIYCSYIYIYTGVSRCDGV